MTKDQELLYQILNKVNEVATKVEVNTAYQKGHEMRLNKLEPKVDDLVTQKNISIGKKSVWTIVAGAIGALIMKGLTLIHLN